MTVPDIVDEITEAATEVREHSAQHQAYDWKSRARDLADAERWIGPNVRALVGAELDELHRVITTQLLGTTKNGRHPTVSDSERPAVAAIAAVAGRNLDKHSALSATWRDLLSACKSIDHIEYPADRVKYLRDTVVALASRRRLDPEATGPVHTAAGVVSGYQHDVNRAHWMLGEQVSDAEVENVTGRSALSQDELEELSARCLQVDCKREDFVVWFKIANAFVKNGSCIRSGDVTFYRGTMLAGALANHTAVRENFDQVPEELLTEELRAIQAGEDPNKKPGEFWGFEWDIPSLVYARVEVRDIEWHRARARARTLLDAVIQVCAPDKDTWEVLGGSLLLDGDTSYHYHRFHWGRKHEPVYTALMYENDHVTESLTRTTAEGHIISADTAAALAPVLDLERELIATRHSTPDAVVRAAVRALEHCNTWTEHGTFTWSKFLREHLLDSYTVESFAHATVGAAFDAAVRYVPDHSPGARRQPELEAIKRDICPEGIGGRIVRARTVKHISALRRIYSDHWLSRKLAELEDMFASADALATAFKDEHDRIDARVDRLQRQRNAAIHGGTLSSPACASISAFADRIAETAMYNTVRATIDGLEVAAHTKERREVYRLRTQRLTEHGDVDALFHPIPPGTLGASPIAKSDESETERLERPARPPAT